MKKNVFKKIITISLFVLFIGMLFFFQQKVIAQNTSDDIAKKYNITFPVQELGGCKNYAECRTYCEDPLNQTICVAFAKAKGFYHEDNSDKKEVLDAAKTELGCADIASCQTICQNETNIDKCRAFAKKHNIDSGEGESPEKKEIVEKAKTTLGCDSASSCKTVCEKEENRQKCDDFAKKAGLRGGERRLGPGGCTSEESCKSFCSDPNNFQICSNFTKGSKETGEQFKGPGGCTNEENCKKFCQDHPQECRMGRRDSQTGSNQQNLNLQEACFRTPGCRWDNNTCQCGQKNGNQGEFGQSEKPFEKEGQNPEAICKQRNCTWENNSCMCQNSLTPPEGSLRQQNFNSSSTNFVPPPNPQGSPPIQSEHGSSNGPKPEDICKQRSGCKWEDNTCRCSEVKGASTGPSDNFFRTMFQIINSLFNSQ